MSEPAVLLTALIVENPMCLDCIAKKTTLTVEAAETALTVIARALPIHRAEEPCRACGAPATVFVRRPPQRSTGR